MEPLALTVAVLLVKGAVEGLAGPAGAGIASLARRATAVVTRRFTDDGAAARALTHAREAPADEERIAALAVHVERHLAEDAEFADRLRGLLAEAERDAYTGPAVISVRDAAHVGKIAHFGVVNGDVSF